MVRRINKIQRLIGKATKITGDAIKEGFSTGDKMRWSMENGYRPIDYVALNERCNMSLWDQLIESLSIDKFCNFNDKNEKYLKRLMALNIHEHNITMKALGTDAAFQGDGSYIRSDAASPSYTAKINYTDNYAKRPKTDVTRVSKQTGGDYTNHGQLYYSTDNLFPDDSDLLSGNARDVRWNATDENSILSKTKKMFMQSKINTIISRFHTDGGIGGGTDKINSSGDSKSKFGKSHGRNLLTKSAEDKGDGGYNINGYNNPYCRVWTHHYQYDRLFKRIRPFYTINNDGSYGDVRRLSDVHKWSNFSHSEDNNGNVTSKMSEENKWGWKAGDNDIVWNKSVLQDNGFVNITPKYLGGGESNIHTKQCMFSIENLAWKGYDPYSFEQALSWEQRGPNGGRIMWFPPYGIEFNETTNVNWNNNSFIGRGEDVYTYVNTQRTGTLSFMMVVDHPSVIDYVSWHGGEKEGNRAKDSDLLRFFAGCDEANSENDDSLLSYVRPTPLTDEYLQEVETEELTIDANPVTRETEEKKTTETLEVSFYVFFPNNYSGYYDHMGNTVEAIAYLLSGIGAQKNVGDVNSPQDTKDIPLTMDMLADKDTWMYGNGYEIKNHGGVDNEESHQRNYIVGTTPNWQLQKKNSKYHFNGPKWYYRIDGEYEIPKASEYYVNTYDQYLLHTSNYKDSDSFGLNSDTEEVRKLFNYGDDEENKKVLFSLSEIAAALESDKNPSISDNIIKNTAITQERVDKAKKIFYGESSKTETDDAKTDKTEDDKTETDNTENRKEGKYRLMGLSIIGYSNSHDKNKGKSVSTKGKSIAQERNNNLADNRGKTIADWLQSRYSGIFKEGEYTNNITHESSVKVDASDKTNASGETAKKWRSAKVTMTFERDVTITLSEANNNEQAEYIGYTKIKDENQKDCYKDVDGNIWYLSSDGKHFSRKTNKLGNTVARSGNSEGNNNKVNFINSWYEINAKQYDVFRRQSTYPTKVKVNKGGQTKYYINFSSINKLNGEWKKNINDEYNNLRYDQEYYFFKQLKNDAPDVFDKLMDKIQYFDPAFHSTTPEGFNARLTFLQQCTRQGNTIGASDRLAKSANNLAFGRAPYCVLRLGDFYNQMIVIDNISINYDPLQWDLNTEGIGVQPLLAHVNISFKFIGGGDMSGPVRRLQNAMTFNYYANTRLYDNRADRPLYKENYMTGISELDTANSYAYTTAIKKKIE